MSTRSEHLPLPGLLLPLLTAVVLLSATAPDHLLITLALAGLAALAVSTGALPVTGQVVSVRRRSEVCRSAGVRSSDPDRPGLPRPRAPGLDS
ncbi:hypothetical protein [Ornithinimicrobium avium]|uniref:hypothetical protein n=1 Tax=Ornithinimicrobium avium TaxID=2283195 RepID=UPI0013B3829B|nr:hypothetical protein [Ornithinimicrobium avium]